MLITYTDLLEYHLGAIDGMIGRVRDLYFDESTWTIRYLVANAGVAKFMKRLLVTPSTVATVDHSRQVVLIQLTSQQVTDSPDLSLDTPMSRQIEAAYQAQFGCGPSWENRLMTDQAMSPGDLAVVQTIVEAVKSSDRPHLRSCHEVTSFRLQTAAGIVGTVVDMLVDDRTWQVDAIIFKIGIEHRVLKSAHLQQIRWMDGAVYSDATPEVLALAPDYPI